MLFPGAACYSLEIENVQLHLRIVGMEEAAPPEIFEGNIIFSFEAERPVRHVGIAFRHENFNRIHTYYRNSNGIYFFLYPVPENQEYIDYRITVDGLWQPDPENSRTVRDNNNIRLSRISVPEVPQYRITSPVVEHNGIVQFILHDSPGKTVYVAGTFNNWDPFFSRMREVRPGVYSTRLRMNEGTHFYHYIVNGERILDPHNTDIGYNWEGVELSTFTIPGLPRD